MHANALENAMLCVLSFDEFASLAVRLHAIAPEVRVLTTLVPEVRKLQERGHAWSDVLFVFARTFYKRNDPKGDAGRYGEARSNYHLILAHRRDLRLSRIDWRLALVEFCALSMRMASDCKIRRGGDADPHSPEEFLSILTDAIPEVDQYLLASPGDDDLRLTRDRMEEMIAAFRHSDPHLSDQDWLRWQRHWKSALAFFCISICIFVLYFVWLMLAPEVRADGGALGDVVSVFASIVQKPTNWRVFVLQASAALAVVHAVNLLVCGIGKRLAARRANSIVRRQPATIRGTGSEPIHVDQTASSMPIQTLQWAGMTITRNPYRKIMMTCPSKKTEVFTGINSHYFEDWEGTPPKDGAKFVCSACGQWHEFDATNTWLE